MIAGRHNAPLHNHRANRAGDPGDCTSSVASNLLWRRLGRFLADSVLVGFVLNKIWEMAQADYVETAVYYRTSALALCTRAAAGDLGIILGICAAGSLAAGDLRCGLSDRWNNYATTAVPGLAYAARVEQAAAGARRLPYTEGMPVVPGLGAAKRKEICDESNRRMDGRRNVNLDRDRRSGRDPAGRRDWQDVQEVIARPRPAREINC